jgi:hypothetical protein
MASSTSAARSGGSFPEHVGLFVLGQFLQHVGQALVVERVDHLVTALVRQFADRFGHLDGALTDELLEQLCDTLVGHRQAGRGEPLDVLPVDDVHIGAAAEAPCGPDRDLGHHPVARAGGLDGEIDHVHVDSAQLL